MNTYSNTLSVPTSKREELLDITSQVEQLVNDSGIQNGLCHIMCPHTTAGITINENADAAVKRDVIYMLNKLIPNLPEFQHAEGNSDAHVKSSLFGASETVSVKNGSLQLGTWQGLLFAEFDGSRTRKVIVTILGE